MRPTRRGFAVLAVAVAGLLISARFGQPGLTAVAGPLFAGVFAAAVQVRWSGAPTVELGHLRRGFPGETKPVEFRVDGSGIATVTDRLSEGLEGETTVTKSLPATVTYRVTYTARGEQQVGPVEATVTVSNESATKTASVSAVATDENRSRVIVESDNRSLITGTNGTAAWTFVPTTGTVTVYQNDTATTIGPLGNTTTRELDGEKPAGEYNYSEPTEPVGMDWNESDRSVELVETTCTSVSS